MRICIIIFCFSLFHNKVMGQSYLTKQDSIAGYFNDVKSATTKAKKLWDKNLYGPLMLVDIRTRMAYASHPDSAGIFKKDGKIYSGILPDAVIIANRSLHWGGRDWAMIMTGFLTNDKKERIELLSHERYHIYQPELGFPPVNYQINAHLDMKDGRIYLRLELEALKAAGLAHNNSDRIMHLTNALIFRRYRHELYPDAKKAENSIELNEGIASYTGKIIAGWGTDEAGELMMKRINKFIAEPSYMQSFAYNTIPVYGYVLRRKKKYWNKEITSSTNLTDYFQNALAITIPENLKEAAAGLSNQYNGEVIILEETKREESIKAQVKMYKMKFIEPPHFEISFEKKSISFDSRYVVTVEDKGIVYPTMTVMDNWGILKITEVGGLLSPNRDKITITVPLKFEGNLISGDGWILQLKDVYDVVKSNTDGNYKLNKK